MTTRDAAAQLEARPSAESIRQPLVLWFDELGIDDVPRVGGKNASLGEMVQALAAEGVKVPGGFATTSAAYRSYVEANRLDEPLRHLLAQFKAG